MKRTGPSPQFSDDYTLKKRLGAGAFAEVYLCAHKESGEVRAVKRVDRTFLRYAACPVTT
jgi:serine/threonine protein kinase